MDQILPLRIRIPRVPVAVQFTREGLVYVLLSLAIGAAAVNTGNNILYLIFSFMLGLIVVSGMLSRRMLSGMTASVDFPSDLFAGVKNLCYLSLFNRKKRVPSLGIRMVTSGAHFPVVERFFFFVPPGGEVHSFAPVLFPKRGVFTLKELELQTRFPFSFFVKIRRYFLEQQVRVYPHIYDLSEEWLARFADGLMFEAPYRGDSHQLLHLREYGPNDSSNRIHWKASARKDRVLVKEFQKEQGRDLYIYFDCYPAQEAESPMLDRATSLVASLAFLVRRRGLEAVFVFADRSFRVGSQDSQLTPLLDHLAEMRTGNPPHTGSVPAPESNALVLVIRSRNTRPVMPAWPSARNITVEDSASLLKEPQPVVEGK